MANLLYITFHRVFTREDGNNIPETEPRRAETLLLLQRVLEKGKFRI
jgi:hypothetical protein